jgi:hypothetical protein
VATAENTASIQGVLTACEPGGFGAVVRDRAFVIDDSPLDVAVAVMDSLSE